MSLDIDSFVKLSESKKGQKEQVEIFKNLLPQEIKEQIGKFERNVEIKSAERTELNRDIVKLKGSIDKHPLNFMGNPALKKVERIDLEKVYAELKLLGEHNEKVERGIEKSKQFLGEQERLEKEEKELAEKLLNLRKAIKENNSKILLSTEWIKENSKKDISESEKKIAAASKQNTEYESAQALLKQRKELETYETESGEMTANIESQRESIQRTIKEMVSPVEDLTFDEEKLIYKGFPVHPASLSSSAIMELGVKMKLAENDLGILFIENSNLLGKEKWEHLLKMASDNDLQVIAEQVERGEEKLRIEVIKLEDVIFTDYENR